MYKEMLFDYQISDDLLDNAPYPKKEIERYNLAHCLEGVKKKIKEYRIAIFEYPNIPKPKITTNYEIRYECFILHKNDSVGKYVELKIDKETEIKILYSDFVHGLSFLSRAEFTYFMDNFLYDISENKIIEKLDTTRFLFNGLRDSCIVKMAKAFNVAELK